MHLTVERDIVTGSVEAVDEGRRCLLRLGCASSEHERQQGQIRRQGAERRQTGRKRTECHAGIVAERRLAVGVRDARVAVDGGDADEVVVDLDLVRAQPDLCVPSSGESGHWAFHMEWALPRAPKSGSFREIWAEKCGHFM